MELPTLHDRLTAWQRKDIGAREAMRLARIDTLEELREAADLSGVAMDMDPHDRDSDGADDVGRSVDPQSAGPSSEA